MIREWLIKHWIINETGKLICTIAFLYFSWGAYQTDMMFGAFLSGILFVAGMVIFADIVTVLIKKALKREVRKNEKV